MPMVFEKAEALSCALSPRNPEEGFLSLSGQRSYGLSVVGVVGAAAADGAAAGAAAGAPESLGVAR